MMLWRLEISNAGGRLLPSLPAVWGRAPLSFPPGGAGAKLGGPGFLRALLGNAGGYICLSQWGKTPGGSRLGCAAGDEAQRPPLPIFAASLSSPRLPQPPKPTPTHLPAPPRAPPAAATDRVLTLSGAAPAERSSVAACATTDHMPREEALQMLEETCSGVCVWWWWWWGGGGG